MFLPNLHKFIKIRVLKLIIPIQRFFNSKALRLLTKHTISLQFAFNLIKQPRAPFPSFTFNRFLPLIKFFIRFLFLRREAFQSSFTRSTSNRVTLRKPHARLSSQKAFSHTFSRRVNRAKRVFSFY